MTIQEPTSGTARDELEETLPDVLATQARGRASAELWTTAIGGVMNATLIGLQFPRFYWLAAGFAAVAAYGSWGLADRALTARRRVEPSEPANDSSSDFAAEPASE